MTTKFDYTAKRAIAERLINKFGQPASFTVKGNTGGFDGFGNAIPVAPDTVIAGVVTPVDMYSTREINGETILMGDGVVYFHSDAIVPIGAVITINGKVWRAVNNGGLTSVDGINVYQGIQVRSDG